MKFDSVSIARNEDPPILFAPETEHRLKPLLGKPVGSLVVHEIYRSLQGESKYAGLPCIFVRLTACHLRCSYCDTPHAFGRGDTMTLDAVIERVAELGPDMVEITGGEPLLQPECLPLMKRLADEGRTVLLETSGGLSIAGVDPRVHVILDVKTPDSAEVSCNLESNYALLKGSDEVKYVVCSADDTIWSIRHVREHRLHERCQVVFSPAFDDFSPAEAARLILESRLPIKLQLQLHKEVWGPAVRGV